MGFHRLTCFRLVSLVVALAARHVAHAVDIPYFAMKLIVVGMPDDIDDTFDEALREATTAHLSSSLSQEANFESTVELQPIFAKAQIPQNLTEGVDLTVVNVVFHGTADVGIAQNIDLLPFLESAFGQTEGFPVFSSALEHDERLHGVGKLQVGLNDVIVGEGTLVARAGHDEEDDDPPNDEDGLSRRNLILIVVFSTIAWVAIVYGAYIVWRVERDRRLEKWKEQRRQANKTRRLVTADGRSSSRTQDFNSSTGSDYSPSKRSARKKVSKSKMMISKPSRQAKRHKMLLSIAEQDEESSCDEEASSNGGSFVSCESMESATDGHSKPSEKVSLTAVTPARTQVTSRIPQGVGLGIDRMDHLSLGSPPSTRKNDACTQLLPAPKNRNKYDEKMPGVFVKQRATGNFKPFAQASSPPLRNAKATGTGTTEMARKPIETASADRASSASSFGVSPSSNLASGGFPVSRIEIHDSQTSTEKPVWSDLMNSVNSNNSILSAPQQVQYQQPKTDSQSTLGSVVWGDLLNSTNSMVQSTSLHNHGSLNSGNQSLASGSTTNGSRDVFFDDGIDQTGRDRALRHNVSSPAKKDRNPKESGYGSQMHDLEMSCAYFDMGDEAIGNKSMHWDASLDLANYTETASQLDVEYGTDNNSGSSSMGPGWRLT